MSKLRPTREEMCAALVDAGIDFPPRASISQIRALYDDLLFGFPSSVPADLPAPTIGSVVVETTPSNITSAPDVTTLASVTKTSATADKTSATSVNTTSCAKTSDTLASSAQTLVTSAPSPVTSVLSSVTLNLAPAALASAADVAPALLDNYNTDAQLDAELSRLRKQKEILDLKRTLSEASIQSTHSLIQAPVRIELSAVESMVSPFSGDDAYDVNKWFNDLEDAFSILQFDERARFVGCRRLTTGTASAFLRTISVNSYNELKRAMLKEFGRSFTLQEVFMCLQSRRLKAGESLRRYVIEMQEIASRAAVPESELIDLIIEGMGDKSSNVAMLYGATTMDEFKLLLSRYERRRLLLSSTASNRPVISNGAIRTQQATNTRKVAVPNLAATTTSASSAAASIRCFNCSRYGHYQTECPSPKRPEGSCFRCGSLSHIYRNCPNRASVQAAAVQAYDHENAVVEGVNALQMVSVDFISMAEKCTERFLSLFDSGSPRSFISSTAVPLNLLKPLVPTKYFGLSTSHRKLYTHGNVKCKISFQNKFVMHTFVILPSTTMFMPIIVGRDLLSKLNVNLCTFKYKYSKEKLLELRNVEVNKKINSELSRTLDAFELNVGLLKNLNICKSSVHKTAVISKQDKIERSSEHSFGNHHIAQHDNSISVHVCATEKNSDEFEIDINPALPCQLIEKLKSIIFDNYCKIPSDKSLPYNYKMSISLIHDTPIFCRPRPLSYDERTKVQKLISNLMQQDIIRPSSSPYASPIVLVRKKNGDIRKCVDYRALNKITVRDNHPLPLIDNCLEHLGGKKFFTMLDLKNGFHQVHMHPDSIKYTSFVTPDGQYEYLRMPFGLKNAPPVFQRLINNVLRDLITDGKLVAYLDDILIASEDFDSHIRVVSEVLLRFHTYGLELRLKKCKFAYSEIEYLGYKANASGIIPSDTHLAAIKHYPPPKDIQELKRCLGLFSYFRRFVPSFSKIAYPLSQLTKKDRKYEFDDQCMNAFVELRNRLTEAPVLSIYNPKADTELHCDASSRGYGAVLLQKQPDKKFHPVAYFSKTASESESKLHSYVLETLSVVYALRRFHTYLDGIQFKIVTDCNSLVQTLSNRSISAKIARWALEFESYDYVIQYRSGANMNHVDALSRVQFFSEIASAEVGKCVHSVNEADLDFQLQIAQNRDSEILRLRSQLETDCVNNFELINGVVFRKRGTGNLQLVVPTEMIENVIRSVHEKIGHLGVNKCCSEISKHYWFTQMKNRVQNFIRNCLKCIVYTTPTQNRKRCALYSIPKKAVPFDTIHVDHVGPLPSIKSKKKYILVIVDSFTKFTKLYPATSTSARELCNSLETYFSYYSRPVRIISDRGSCFTSSEFDKFVQDRNIQHIKTAVAAPRANGQVERANREIIRILSKLSEPVDHSNWVQCLSRVEYALNNSVHSTTLSSPSELLFGVEQRGEVIDELTEYLDGKLDGQNCNIKVLRSKALENIEKSQQKSLNYFNKHHTSPEQFQKGDYVMITNIDTSVGSNKKLIPQYRGPYIIAKALKHDRYLVRDIDGCQITQLLYNGIIDLTRLKKWRELPDQSKCNKPTESTPPSHIS